MTVTLDDPAKVHSLTIGYSESHLKGDVPYCLPRDPLFARSRPTIDDPLPP